MFILIEWTGTKVTSGAGLPEDWQHQKAVIFVLIELNTQVNE